MKLLHYTNLACVEAIQREGLTLGHLPLPHGATGWLLLPGHQWLTDDRDWRQGWATNITRACGDSTAARVWVRIPASAQRQLWRWNRYARSVLRWEEETLKAFNAAGGSDGSRWWVFRGSIPPGWLGHWQFRRDNQ